MENFASVWIMTGNATQVIICWNAPGKHNILKRSRFVNARIAALRLPLMLVSRVCLGIDVFDVKIEREAKEKAWQAFQQLGSGMLNFPVSTLLFFFLPLFFYSPFFDSLPNFKHWHACVIVPSPIPFSLPLSNFNFNYFICRNSQGIYLLNAYFIFLLWFRNPYFAYCLVMLILFVQA